MGIPWIPLYVNDPPTDDGPVSMFGYDGNIHPERPSAAEWRAWRMERARDKGTHTRDQWIALRGRIGKCARCGVSGSEVPLAKDHIYPIARGGCDCIENIQPLCRNCNSRKGDGV